MPRSEIPLMDQLACLCSMATDCIPIRYFYGFVHFCSISCQKEFERAYSKDMQSTETQWQIIEKVFRDCISEDYSNVQKFISVLTYETNWNQMYWLIQ